MLLYGPLLVWIAVASFGPYDVTQGISSKLLYVHVPTVWVAYLGYSLTFLYSVLYFFTKKDMVELIFQQHQLTHVLEMERIERKLTVLENILNSL